MKTTIHNTENRGGKFRRIATRFALFIAVLSLGLTIETYWTFKHGGFKGVHTEKLTWLTNDNVQASLHLKDGGGDTIIATPELPVLLVFCPKEVGEDATLDLSAVTEALAGRVQVLALDPYADKEFASGFSKLFIEGPMTKSAAINMAAQILQQQNQPVTKASIEQLLKDEQFLSFVQAQESESPLFKAAYPKFFLFTAKKFSLAAATVGLDNKDDVLAFVNSGLSVIKTNEIGGAKKPTTTATTTADPAAPTANPAVSSSGNQPLTTSTATQSVAAPAVAPTAATVPVAPGSSQSTPATPAATVPAVPAGSTPAPAQSTPTATDTTSGEEKD